MATLPKASWAVTVTLWATPAVVGTGEARRRSLWSRRPESTLTLSVPVMVPVTVSVAVIDWVPTVLSVTEKTWCRRRRR